MRIAIIGGGFTGLTAAYELTKQGHTVTIFEKEPYLGGLAYGFKGKNWSWHLEYAYHHLFTNDKAILSLARELGLADKLITKRPVTATLLPELKEYPSKQKSHTKDAPFRFAQLDSPISLLKFPGLPMIDKLRTGTLVAGLKILRWWQPLEGITAEHFFTSIGGKKAWNTIWAPLMIGKFGDFAPRIAASWLWARIKKRTPKLVYIRGGFQTLVTTLEKTIIKQGGEIRTNTAVFQIHTPQNTNQIEINYTQDSKKLPHGIAVFDAVLVTAPTPLAERLLPMIPASYFELPKTIPHLHAQTLILETDKPILTDTYWLNVTDRSYPFLAAVAHTNFMDKKHYGGHHLTYFGNYLPAGHKYLSMTKSQVLKEFMPFIKRLAHDSSFSIHHSSVFVGPFAQPVHELHYSAKAPKLTTPHPRVFIANMDSIYPWDRGTNYAVELGKRAARAITQSDQ